MVTVAIFTALFISYDHNHNHLIRGLRTNTTRFLKMFSGTGQTKRLGSKAQSEDLVGGGGGGGGQCGLCRSKTRKVLKTFGSDS